MESGKRQLLVVSAIFILLELMLKGHDLTGKTNLTPKGSLHMPRPARVDDFKFCSRLVGAKCCSDYSEFIRPKHRVEPAPPRSTGGQNCLNILLIIVFNSALYDHVAFVREMYKPAFANIVAYGPVENVTLGIKRVESRRVGTYLGRSIHEAVALAMAECPGYEGYMWVSDDMLFNYKLVLSTMNPKNIWIQDKYRPSLGPEWIFNKKPDPYSHYAVANGGLASIRENFNCLPRAYMNRSVERFRGPDRAYLGVSDFGYIPGRFVADFKIMAYSLRAAFHEIAIPTIQYLISPSDKDYEVVERDGRRALWLWDEERKNALDKLSKDIGMLHPIKMYQNPEMQRRLRAKLDKVWGLKVGGSRETLHLPWSMCGVNNY